MKIDNGTNYSIISNDIDNYFLDMFKEYYVVKEDIEFTRLIELLSTFNLRRIVFFDVLRNFDNSEKKEIVNLLNLRNINFINITSDMEEVLLTDFLYVFNNHELVLSGNTLECLNNEQKLKRIGFAYPFAVDLSLQLKLYGILDNIEPDLSKLVDVLWT